MSTLSLSILVICRNFSSTRAVREAIAKMREPGLDFELLVGEGNNPSLQRNRLAEKARGDYLLFLDDDSFPDPKILHYYKNTVFDYPDVGVFGGPALVQQDGSLLARLAKIFFCSVFGAGPFRSRYTPLGRIRETDERELILCNMLVRRDLFLAKGGFSAQFHPNEENEFLKRMGKQTKIIYHPLAIVYRPPRKSLALFTAQMIAYARSRVKHLLPNPQSSEWIFVVPLCFSLYALLLPYLLLAKLWILLLPLAFYFLLALLASATAAIAYQSFIVFWAMPFVFLLGHFCYGFGLWLGAVDQLLLRSVKPLPMLSSFKFYQVKVL